MKKIFFRHGFLLTLILICKSVHAQQILFSNLISPAPIEQSGNALNIRLEFLNNSGSTLTTANFNYSVNGGNPTVLPWTGNLGAGSSDTIIFSPFVIPTGQYSLCFWTTAPSSDTICYTYVGSNSIITPPFSDDFEAPSEWASSLAIPNYLSGWQVGTPNYGVVNTPHSGANSWVIGLDSGYENAMQSYLYSPYFNFSSGNNLQISFWQNRHTEVTRDGAWLEYSLDSGLTWSVLGTFKDTNATNWYNDSLYQGNNLHAWDSASNGWRQSTYEWQLGSWPLVQLRFGFYANATGTMDGIAIDDFAIDSCNISANLITTNISCFNGNDGLLCASVLGGATPYSYLWSNTSTTQCITNLFPGIYSVTVTDSNNCVISISGIVTQPALLNDSIVVTDATCGVSNGNIIVYAYGGTGPYSYQWSNGISTQSITNLSPGIYTVTITDANACIKTDQATVNNIGGPVIVIDSVQNVSCFGGNNGAIYISVSGGTIPYSYIWSNFNTTQDLQNIPAGTYTITVTDANICMAIASITLSCDSVWPGDANYDGVANNLDLLPIGLAYGSTGTIRPGATNNWTGQPANDWGQSIPSGTDYKHVDCNGDGIINDADSVAIIQNYGQTHPFKLLPTVQNLLDPTLYFDIVVDTAGTSQQIDVPLMFGTSTIPADSIYGLAFTVNYDTALVRADSVNIDFTTSWIGTIGTDMITLQHNDPLNGQLHVGMTRTDHNNISGFGQIAKITVVTVDNVSGRMASVPSLFDTLTFTLSDVTIIDKDENIRNVTIGGDTLIIQDSTTTVHEILFSEKVKVYPNPAKDKLFVEIP
ncbi:MAG TPA: hypothetical protein VJY62_18475, partial [Bacteroidia bacterium]|nr:hypothetical protein [Bacteroidia bacterium]